MTAARAMVQAQGYNSLSFRELAKQIGIKSASVHYYFPTKGDLGAALAREYTDEFRAYLDGLVDAGKDWKTCIRDYTDVFRQHCCATSACAWAASSPPSGPIWPWKCAP